MWNEYFEDVETTEEYNGYFFSISATIIILILGTFCGLKNMKQIRQWATNERIRGFLKEKFGTEDIVCYSWFTQVIGLIKPESLNNCFMNWVKNMVKDKLSGSTFAIGLHPTNAGMCAWNRRESIGYRFSMPLKKPVMSA